MNICLSHEFLRIATPAKLNLFLELRSKREDGFHELETIMCKWSLFDWMTLVPSKTDSIELSLRKHPRLDGQEIPSDESNLIIKTLLIMRDLAGQSFGTAIKLFKCIPVEAGLGGASSNAAAAIVGANHLWKLNWSKDKLMSVAAQIGSDVAFFLGGSLARCTGKGEQVQNLNYPCRLNLVVVKPRVGMSTAKIYSRCTVPKTPINSNAIVEGLRLGRRSKIGKALFNRLERYAEQDHIDISRMRAEFEKTNCIGHQLTGSGACYFGIYNNTKSMRSAARQIASRLPEMKVMTGHTIGSRKIDRWVA